MLVYRLEKNEYGPFCGQSEVDMCYPSDSLYSKFGFTCSQEFSRNPEYRSACESIDKLIEYFGSDFAYALNKGMSIVQYRVDKRNVRFGIYPDRMVEVAFHVPKVKERTVIYKGEDSCKKSEICESSATTKISYTYSVLDLSISGTWKISTVSSTGLSTTARPQLSLMSH